MPVTLKCEDPDCEYQRALHDEEIDHQRTKQDLTDAERRAEALQQAIDDAADDLHKTVSALERA